MKNIIKNTFRTTLQNMLILTLISTGLTGCGSSNRSSLPAPTPVPAPVFVNGVIADGPVTGGTVFVFSASQVLAALASIGESADRLAALTAADSIASLTRQTADGAGYSFDLPSDIGGNVVFIIFDNTDAEDESQMDTPPNLGAVVTLGAAGVSTQTNVSMQSTLATLLVLAQLDPDGDGTPIDAAAIQAALADATANVLTAFSRDALGRDLYPDGFDPVSETNSDLVFQASGPLGSLVRAAAALLDLPLDVVVAALAADAGDGAFDGVIPMSLMPSPEVEALAEAVNGAASADSDEEIAVFAVGPCSSATVALRQACAVDGLDNLLESRAICADTADDADRAECETDAVAELQEGTEECDAIFEARLGLCEELSDAAHEPMFGPEFADNFVDPLEIGNGEIPLNPWFPLKTGNRWLYSGDGESIDVRVTDETKLIDGITCVVVIDTASEDDVVVEITRDWYAQDIDGNVWYCGEIARNFEIFDGDEPMDPELVDIDGSWKAGRDGAEPGILLPFDPQIDDVIRQEVKFGEAEDVIRIASVTETATSPGGNCVMTCLQTTDTTPLEPEVAEAKYYAPDIGLIVEVNLEDQSRVELISFTPGP